MKNRYSIIMTSLMASPVIAFLVFWLINGEIPSKSLFDVPIFYMQTGMTIVTILAIPFLLWYIRRDKFPQEEEPEGSHLTKYQTLCVARMGLFETLTIIDLALFFFLPNITFFYLAVVTYLSMFFARR